MMEMKMRMKMRFNLKMLMKLIFQVQMDKVFHHRMISK